MSRNGSGVYSLPPGYLATDGNTATASQHNSPLEDLQTDMNTARPIVAGGTGSTSADAAILALGGQNLADIKDLAVTDGGVIVGDGANFVLETGATARTSLGLGSIATQNSTNINGTFTKVAGADVAAATELLLLTSGNYVTVTGDATVTWIETTANAIPVGREIDLYFTGTVTFTHNATNLVCPGGVDLALTPGDRCRIRKYASGDWEVISVARQLSASGPVVKIEQQILSSDTEADFDLPAGYQSFKLVLNSVRRSPSGTHGALVYRASADGGSTFTSTSSYFGGDSPVSTSTTATYGTLAPAATSGTTYYVDGHIDIYATSQGLSVMSRLSAKSSTSTYDTYSKDWVNSSATGVDAIRLLLDNGNAMVSGTITLYGYN